MDIEARAEELKVIEYSARQQLSEQKRKGIQSSLKSMITGGSAELAAMINERGEIVTKLADIAECQYVTVVGISRGATKRFLVLWLTTISSVMFTASSLKTTLLGLKRKSHVQFFLVW